MPKACIGNDFHRGRMGSEYSTKKTLPAVTEGEMRVNENIPGEDFIFILVQQQNCT